MILLSLGEGLGIILLIAQSFLLELWYCTCYIYVWLLLLKLNSLINFSKKSACETNMYVLFHILLYIIHYIIDSYVKKFSSGKEGLSLAVTEENGSIHQSVDSCIKYLIGAMPYKFWCLDFKDWIFNVLEEIKTINL